MNCTECRDLLSALYDDELSPTETAAVTDHLRTCPDCLAHSELLARTSHTLKEQLVRYPAPDALRQRIRNELAQEDAPEMQDALERTRDAAPDARSFAPRTPRRNHWLRLAAAGVVIALASSAATYAMLQHGASADAATSQLLASHVRSLMPGHLIDIASNDQHNVKPWFNGRVDLSPQVPGLDSAGFILAGGRLDYVDGRSVAAVVYTRRQHVINVYSWPDAGDNTGASSTASHGYHFVRWRADNVEYCAISDLNSAELSQFVVAYQGGAVSGARMR